MEKNILILYCCKSPTTTLKIRYKCKIIYCDKWVVISGRHWNEQTHTQNPPPLLLMMSCNKTILIHCRHIASHISTYLPVYALRPSGHSNTSSPNSSLSSRHILTMFFFNYYVVSYVFTSVFFHHPHQHRLYTPPKKKKLKKKAVRPHVFLEAKRSHIKTPQLHLWSKTGNSLFKWRDG